MHRALWEQRAEQGARNLQLKVQRKLQLKVKVKLTVSPFVGSNQGAEGIEPRVLRRTSETRGQGRRCSSTVVNVIVVDVDVVGRFL